MVVNFHNLLTINNSIIKPRLFFEWTFHWRRCPKNEILWWRKECLPPTLSHYTIFNTNYWIKKKLFWRMVTLTKVSTVQRDDLQIIIIDTWSKRGIQMSNEFKTANFIKGNILMSNHGFNSDCPKNTNKTTVAFVASPWLHILTYSILVCLVTAETCQSHIGSSSSSRSVLPAAAHPIPFHRIYHISSGALHLSKLRRLDSPAKTCHGQRYPPKNEKLFELKVVVEFPFDSGC